MWEGQLTQGAATLIYLIWQEAGMTIVRTATVLVMLSLSLAAQSASAPQTTTARPQPAPAANVHSILSDLQRVTIAANGDIGRLRIYKWKADSAQRQQIHQVAESLPPNLSTALAC